MSNGVIETALCVIAIAEIVRLIQNTIQLITLFKRSDSSQVKRATDAFIESLKKDIEFENALFERGESNADKI